ncbi:hypothetical protein [Nonomuraea lactucae]|uniref:hypothetical protein n=1 Tax=Nonomuraea lactucae TaxID=2249762 RepID=UPI0013B46162|nr:hypothetical protein [Nonomuraea lactucae]
MQAVDVLRTQANDEWVQLYNDLRSSENKSVNDVLQAVEYRNGGRWSPPWPGKTGGRVLNLRAIDDHTMSADLLIEGAGTGGGTWWNTSTATTYSHACVRYIGAMGTKPTIMTSDVACPTDIVELSRPGARNGVDHIILKLANIIPSPT